MWAFHGFHLPFTVVSLPFVTGDVEVREKGGLKMRGFLGVPPAEGTAF
jgi:hypothetical protein